MKSYIYLNISLFIYIFKEKGREEDREGEKHQYVVASHTPHTVDLTHNTGKSPDWESNQQHFSSPDGTQSTEPHQPVHIYFNLKNSVL